MSGTGATVCMSIPRRTSADMSKRAPKPLITPTMAVVGLGLAALWMWKAGPNKRPSVDGLPVHVNGNGPAFSPDGCSLEKMAYC